MLPKEASYFHPAMVRLMLFNYTEGVRITIRQEKGLWRIIRGGQITNIFFRGKRDSSWELIRGIWSSFMRSGSIINGDVR